MFALRKFALFSVGLTERLFVDEKVDSPPGILAQPLNVREAKVFHLFVK